MRLSALSLRRWAAKERSRDVGLPDTHPIDPSPYEDPAKLYRQFPQLFGLGSSQTVHVVYVCVYGMCMCKYEYGILRQGQANRSAD